MREHKPDKWEIVEFNNNGKIFHKVMAEWKGGYLDGDSWKISSVIEDYELKGDYYHFKNMSGSKYICHKDMKSLGFLTHNIYDQAKKKCDNSGISIEIVDVESIKNRNV